MTPDGQTSREAQEFIRLVVMLLSGATLLLVGSYFVVAVASITGTLQTFLLAIFSNLIPVLLVAIISLTVIRGILDRQRRWESSQLQAEIIQAVGQKIDEIPLPSVDELKEVLSREFRDALTAPDPARQIDESPPGRLDVVKREIIGDILHTMSVALIFPKSRSRVFVRAFCHLPDRNSGTLRPICMWSSERETEDFDAVIPYEGADARHFVIAEAFAKNRLVRRNLPEDHIELYPPELREKILPELRGVIALPIASFDPACADEPLGTISIDSNQPLERLGFQDETVRDVLIWGARAVRRVLLMGVRRDEAAH